MKAKYFILVIALSNLLSACQKKDVITQTPKEKIELSRTRISLVKHLIDSFTVETDVPWTIKGMPHWLNAAPMSGGGKGLVKLSASNNDSSSYRGAFLVVSPNLNETFGPDTVYVSQGKGICKASKLLGHLTPYENSTDTIFLSVNVPWEMSFTSDWLSVKSVKLNDSTQALVLTARLTNTSPNDREVDITITPNFYTSLPLFKVKVVQDGERSTLYGKCFGGSKNDSALSIIRTVDQAYLMAGSTNSYDGDIRGNHGGFDAWLLKFDQSAIAIWSKVYGGSGNDYFKSVLNTADGGFIATGYSNSNDGDLPKNYGGFDAWIVKFDASGSKQWISVIGGSGNDVANSIAATPDGGYVIVGQSDSFDGDFVGSGVGDRGFVIKVDAQGKLLWKKSLTGYRDNSFNSVISTSDGIVAAGWIAGSWLTADDGIIVKLSHSGNQIWINKIGGSLTDHFAKVIEVSDGYIVVGFAESTDVHLYCQEPTIGGWIGKLNKDGRWNWSVKHGGSGDDEFNDIVEHPEGGFVMVGTNRSKEGSIYSSTPDDIWSILVGVDGKFKSESVAVLPKNEGAHSIVARFDKGYLVAGFISYGTQTNYFKGGCDAYITTF